MKEEVKADPRDEKDVLVVLNEKGNCIFAGDPTQLDRKRKNEIGRWVAEGYTAKTIKFKEYKLLDWY